MVDEFGQPLLADFGVAELVDWPSCTVSGALTGTPMYMSPEQARAERVGPASDIYSLAVVLYEALTGAIPYDLPGSPNTASVLDAVKNQKPLSPRKFNPHVSRDLEFTLLKALAKDAQERYPDVKSFAADLENIMEGRPLSGRLLTPLHWIKHALRRNRTMVLILSIGGLLVVSALIFYRRQMAGIEQARTLELAGRRSLELQLSSKEMTINPVNVLVRAWNDIRIARQAMQESRWQEAYDGLKSAAALSDAYHDRRTGMIARLEGARCAWMMGNTEEAVSLYQTILDGTAVSPTAASVARYEYTALTIVLQASGAGEPAILENVEVGNAGAYDAMYQCIIRRLSPSVLLQMMPQMPERFQNDALLAIALREYRDGNAARFEDGLKRCRKMSKPSTEWPSPLAMKLSTLDGIKESP
jgi:hypothetical protein